MDFLDIDPFNRRLTNQLLREQGMTICIAALCGYPQSTTILLCADKLVSAGIQFEGGASKIREVTQNCYVMTASNNSLISDAVYQNLIARFTQDSMPRIKEIVEALCEECVKYKRMKQEKDVLSKYNMANEYLKSDPNTTIKNAIVELENYPYPEFEFIVAGFDMKENAAYIYKVNQDGDYSNWNFLGFAVTGSGESLAFSELTKHSYSSMLPFSHAIPRVIFAKKTSERAQGVGQGTDMGYINMQYDPKDPKQVIPMLTPMSPDREVMQLFDNAYNDMLKSEQQVVSSLQQTIDKLIKKAVDEQSKKESEEKTNPP